MVLSSTRNPLVRELTRLRTSARQRRQQGRVLVVGARALREALLGPERREHLPLETLLLPVPAESPSVDERLFSSEAAREVAVSRALSDIGLDLGAPHFHRPHSCPHARLICPCGE